MTVGVAILLTIIGWLVLSVAVGEAIYRYGSNLGSRVEHYFVGAGVVLIALAIAALLTVVAFAVVSLWGVPL